MVNFYHARAVTWYSRAVTDSRRRASPAAPRSAATNRLPRPAARPGLPRRKKMVQIAQKLKYFMRAAANRLPGRPLGAGGGAGGEGGGGLRRRRLMGEGGA